VREYVEDQLGAINDLDARGAFEIALLSGSEFVVDDQNVGVERVGQLFQFLHLAVSEQRGRVDFGTDLEHFGRDLRPGAGGQFGELSKGFGRSTGCSTSAPFKARQNCFLRGLLE
jgi:hypothetical protein